jgi:uncharacterized protein YcbK (DUF882 family)
MEIDEVTEIFIFPNLASEFFKNNPALKSAIIDLNNFYWLGMSDKEISEKIFSPDSVTSLTNIQENLLALDTVHSKNMIENSVLCSITIFWLVHRDPRTKFFTDQKTTETIHPCLENTTIVFTIEKTVLQQALDILFSYRMLAELIPNFRNNKIHELIHEIFRQLHIVYSNIYNLNYLHVLSNYFRFYEITFKETLDYCFPNSDSSEFAKELVLRITEYRSNLILPQQETFQNKDNKEKNNELIALISIQNKDNKEKNIKLVMLISTILGTIATSTWIVLVKNFKIINFIPFLLGLIIPIIIIMLRCANNRQMQVR